MTRSTAHLDFGSLAQSTEGPCGAIVGVYLHPTWRITHIVVHGRHEHGLERLVPMVLVTSIDRRVELSCTTEQFDRLGFSDEGLPGGDVGSSSAYGADQMTPLPLIDDKRVSISPSYSEDVASFAQALGNANVPRGQVQLRSGVRIDALDGHLGSLRGLEIDFPNATVVGLVVDGGHFYIRREISVPVATIEMTGNEIRVNALKHSFEHLGPIA
jgi:hypothetical protein